MPSASVQQDPSTVGVTVDRLTKRGYTDWFRTEATQLRAARSGCIHSPDEIQVDQYLRFEGVSDPDDEAIVFALRCTPHGVKGTFTVAYGTHMPAADAEIVRRLHLEATRRR